MRSPMGMLPRSSILKDAVSACSEHLKIAAVISAFVNLLYLAPTIYMLQVYDRVVPTGGIGTLLWLTAVLAAALISLSLLDLLRSRLMTKASLRIERSMARTTINRTLAKKSAQSFGRNPVQAMRDFDAIRNAIAGPAALVIFDIPWTPIYLIVAFLIHPSMGALIIFGGALLICVTVLNERTTRSRHQAAYNLMASSYAKQERFAAREETIRALGMQQVMAEQQIEERSRGLLLGREAQLVSGNYTALAKFLRLFLQSCALGLGAWLAINRDISAGAIFAASILVSRALSPVEQFIATLPTIGVVKTALANLQSLYDTTETEQAVKTSLPTLQGSIAFENVHYRQGADSPWLLQKITLSIASGQVVGVVGPSGAGKTTFARILAGGISPTVGVIRLDGADVKDWDPESLATQIGYLPQDVGLMPGTIAQNIARFAKENAATKPEYDEKIIRAAKMAGAHDMIVKLNGGYDRNIGFEGVGLSAGQCQRVALARAFYGNPAILILDEPNSALDAEGDSALMTAIAEARKRKATVVLVSHKPAVLEAVDKIIVLSGGILQRYGKKEDVLVKRVERPRIGAMSSKSEAA